MQDLCLHLIKCPQPPHGAGSNVNPHFKDDKAEAQRGQELAQARVISKRQGQVAA